MAQIDDFFMYENRVEGITDADYQRAQPYVEAAQAFAQTTYQSIYIADHPPVETFPRFYLVLLRQPIAPMEPDGMSRVYQM